MDLAEFKQSVIENNQPADLGHFLLALWFDGVGDWESAHNIVQDIPGAEASWVHAYLHRKEGDNWNAGYWYRRANKKPSAKIVSDEWEDLVRYFIGNP